MLASCLLDRLNGGTSWRGEDFWQITLLRMLVLPWPKMTLRLSPHPAWDWDDISWLRRQGATTRLAYGKISAAMDGLECRLQNILADPDHHNANDPEMLQNFSDILDLVAANRGQFAKWHASEALWSAFLLRTMEAKTVRADVVDAFLFGPPCACNACLMRRSAAPRNEF